MEYLAVFVFGTIIGSFLNVCIYRLPLGRSIVRGRSACPFCEHSIRWVDNVPLISFLVLRGKCRDCARPISVRYFLVELITALSVTGLLYYFSLGPQFFIYSFFTCALIVITFIDMEYQEIPDVITIPGIFIGMVLMTVFRLDSSGAYVRSFLNSVLGVLAGGGSMFLLGYFGEKIFRKEALGGGDVKLMGMIGALLGWKLVLLTFFLSPMFGSCVGIFMKIRFKKEVIPYGPYLSLGALVSLLYGERILQYFFWV
jgi:leader peptidase (prepilin peptidase)/N-methyltransferase